jgi:PadR family transcriptional regulator, regulatory protein PadR
MCSRYRHPIWPGRPHRNVTPLKSPLRAFGDKSAMADLVRDVFLAFARVHVLHHASEERIFGVGMMKELARHGYRLGPGTLYPLLHRMAEDGLLVSEVEVIAGKARRYYVITRKGRAALDRLRPKLRELWAEAGS